MKNPQTALKTKSEKPKSFDTKTEKTDQKNIQNRKTENPKFKFCGGTTRLGE